MVHHIQTTTILYIIYKLLIRTFLLTQGILYSKTKHIMNEHHMLVEKNYLSAYQSYLLKSTLFFEQMP